MVQETSLSGPYLGTCLSLESPRSSVKGSHGVLSPPSPSPSGPRRSALAPELGGGGGGGRQPVPRVP